MITLSPRHNMVTDHLGRAITSAGIKFAAERDITPFYARLIQTGDVVVELPPKDLKPIAKG